MLTALVCKIVAGVGAVTIYPGIVESPRYEGATVRIELEADRATDLVVNGPYDRAWRYTAHGLAVTSVRLADRLLITVAGEGLNAVRESMVLTDGGELLWTQISNADQLHATSASVFVGTCESSSEALP